MPSILVYACAFSQKPAGVVVCNLYPAETTTTDHTCLLIFSAEGEKMKKHDTQI